MSPANGARLTSRAPRTRTLAVFGLTACLALAAHADEPLDQPSWWHPPQIAQMVPLVGDRRAVANAAAARDEARAAWRAAGAPIPSDDLDNATQHWLDCRRAQASLAIRLDGGVRLVVFPFSGLGGTNDLWVVRQESDGSVGPSRFLGVDPPAVRPRRHRPEDAKKRGPLVRGRVDGSTLVLHERGARGRTHRILLTAVDQDSDSDGLTDIVELRLRLDPSRRDTDGDRLDDAHDLAPNALVREPSDENDRIALALVAHELAEEDVPPGALVVVRHARALEWRAPGRPTITLPDTHDRMPEDLVNACVLHLAPLGSTAGGDQDSLGPADANTRDWDVSHFSGTCGSVGIRRVRLTADGWRVQGTRRDKFF